MSSTTIEQLAKLVRISPEYLLTQMKQAGMHASDIQQVITDAEKRRLLTYLRSNSSQNTGEVEVKQAGGTAKKTLKLSRKRHVVEEKTTVGKTPPEPTKSITSKSVNKQAESDPKPTLSVKKSVNSFLHDEDRASVDLQKKLLGLRPEKKVVKVKEKAVEVVAEKPMVAKKLSIDDETQKKKTIFKPSVKARGLANTKRKPATIRVKSAAPSPTVVARDIKIPEAITVAELAKRMSMKATEVIKAMMGMGVMAAINQTIDQETATLIVEEMGHKPILLKESSLEDDVLKVDSDVVAESRAPVVTIMGHVDHGKTTLLDYIRQTRVTAKEAGGITQHIGAYSVETKKGKITFLDTPGHEAFTAIRARGTKATDIVVLVVAADDGVMPQTVEAIQHAKAAKVPILVAINKIDKPDADLDRIKTSLSTEGLQPEDWGGDIICHPLSAKTGEGIDGFLDNLLLISEMEELKAPPVGPARGVVIESRLDKGRGPICTILVNSGCLKKGDVLLAGREYGRVRAMIDDRGKTIQQAGPSTPVEVQGLSGVPDAGDEVAVVPNERKAKEIAEAREGKMRELRLASRRSNSLEELFQQGDKAEQKVLNVLLKADTHGSAEAIAEALGRLGTLEAKVHVVASGVGGITVSDIHLAVASHAVVVGFNVRAEASARRLAEQDGVTLHYYSIIYELTDRVRSILTGMLAPKFEEKMVGLAEVREVFSKGKKGQVAGCLVTEGMMRRNADVRVLRDNKVIYQGKLDSLRRFKDDVTEVRSGLECGMSIKDYLDVRMGDQIESFDKIEVDRVL